MCRGKLTADKTSELFPLGLKLYKLQDSDNYALNALKQ